ncbi:MAG: sugar transferase [Actinomycetota bacterium]
MRVAHLTTVDLALRYLLWPQLRAANDQGWESIGISADGPHVEELRRAGIRHIPLTSSTRGMNPFADVRAVVELWRILRRERVDVLHTHNPKPGLYGRVIGRMAGVPVVVNTVHGLYATHDDPLPKRLLVYALEAVASRFSDAELIQSAEDLERMRRLRIAPAHKLRLLGNGVDLARFDPSRLTAARRRELRAELGAADGQIVVGTVGRLVAEKGYFELFDAAGALGNGYVVVALGHADPEKGDSLSDTDIARGREAGIRFLGMRGDIEELYGAMDIFVLPSHREGVPRAAMEAAAMGLPVVATDIRGCREVVEDGVGGLLVPVGDPSALAVAIRRLGEDAALRRRLGAAGHRRARERFDERRVVSIVLDTYREVLERKGIPSEPRRAPADGRTRRARHRLNDAFKRGIDIVVALIGLAVTAPLFVLLAPAMRATLGTSVLFAQERGGRNGRTFRLYKFRTMRDLHDAEGRPLPDGQRLTRLGRLLRSTSLDELPSLVNVLKGDMSLVGPRPLIADYLALYTPEQARRHEVRPGITGLVQVGGRNALSWDEKFAADVHYVDHRSPWLDVKILALTVTAVLRRRGISQDGHATMPRFNGPGAERAGAASTKSPLPNEVHPG